MLQLLFYGGPLVFVIGALSILIAITVHEFAHAWVAEYLGDPTARLQGRLTLNPLAHLDPLGTLGLFLIGFGWGKPVPFDPYNLPNPRRDGALISLAGPVSNLLLATILAVIIRSPLFIGPLSSTYLSAFLMLTVRWNVMLAIFNLIPIHPLDGGKILAGLLPEGLADRFDEVLQQYGLVILLFLIFPIFGGGSLIWTIISPVINVVMNLLLPGAGGVI